MQVSLSRFILNGLIKTNNNISAINFFHQHSVKITRSTSVPGVDPGFFSVEGGGGTLKHQSLNKPRNTARQVNIIYLILRNNIRPCLCKNFG